MLPCILASFFFYHELPTSCIFEKVVQFNVALAVHCNIFGNLTINSLVENCSNMVITDVYKHDIEYKTSLCYLEWSMWVL